MRTLTEKYTENIGHGLFFNRTSSNHITCKFTVYGCTLQKFRVFLKKNAFTEPIWQKSPSLFFAVENTLSDGAVDTGIARCFLASLEIIGKDVS